MVKTEIPLDMEKLCEHLHYSRKRGKTHSLIVVAEGVMSGSELKSRLQDTSGYDAKVTVLGYIQRGGGPTSFDTVLASRMGRFAVESLVNGASGKMVCSVGGRMVLKPLEEAWGVRKPLNPELLALVDILGV